jgi:hypothetical protein
MRDPLVGLRDRRVDLMNAVVYLGAVRLRGSAVPSARSGAA